MIPLEHTWTQWQENIESENLYDWKWKQNTPKEIKKQYEEWNKYYNEKMKM